MKYIFTPCFFLSFLITFNLSAQCPDSYQTHPDYEAMEDIFLNSGSNHLFESFDWVIGYNGNVCNPCTWEGVFCNSIDRVDHITFKEEFVNFSDAILDLPFLETIVFWSSTYTGEFPEIFTQVEGLTYLDVYNTHGEIPSSIGNLSNLVQLRVSGKAVEGTIPSELSQCTQLEALYLYHTNLSGTIPEEIFSIESLDYVGLNNNSLEGAIPTTIADLIDLTWIDLSFNNLEGSIPENFSNLNAIKIDLSYNNLSGCLDASLLDMCDRLNLSGNKLLPWQGQMDFYCHSSQGYMSQVGSTCDDGDPNTEYSAIDENCNCTESLTNPLEEKCVNQSTEIPILMKIFINGNGSEWYNGDSWVDSYLNGDCSPCTWSGISCNDLGFVDRFSLSDDYYAGSISGAFCELLYLESLLIDEDAQITAIEPEIGNCSNLRVLSVDEAQGYSRFSLPPEIGNLDKLEVLVLEECGVIGELPEEIYNLSLLRTLDLSGNHICGEISESIGQLDSLKFLNLNGNQLEGSIPAVLGTLPNLSSINLGENKLTGLIPAELATLSSQIFNYIDLGANDLSGCIPAEFYVWCSTNSVINLSHNPQLPWIGNYETYCDGTGDIDEQLGALCSGIQNISVLDVMIPYLNTIHEGLIQEDCACSALENEMFIEVDISNSCSEDQSTGIENIESLNSNGLLNISPNPTGHSVTVDIRNIQSQSVEILILDLSGKIIYQEQALSKNMISIDISAYSSGVYIVEVLSNDKVYSEKLIML